MLTEPAVPVVPVVPVIPKRKWDVKPGEEYYSTMNDPNGHYETDTTPL